MRTVGRSEGVVDVGVVTFDERLDEGGVIRRLARIEPEVVEQGHLGEPLGELRPHRFDAIGRVGLAFGRPRWVQAVTLAPAASR